MKFDGNRTGMGPSEPDVCGNTYAIKYGTNESSTSESKFANGRIDFDNFVSIPDQWETIQNEEIYPTKTNVLSEYLYGIPQETVHLSSKKKQVCEEGETVEAYLRARSPLFPHSLAISVFKKCAKWRDDNGKNSPIDATPRNRR